MELPIHSYAVDTQSTARLVNCMPEASPVGAKSRFSLRRSPGIAPYCAVHAPGRGLYAAGNTLYAVGGTGLYSISSSAILLGSISGLDRVTMIHSESQLAIAHNGGLSVYADGALSAVTDPDLPSLGRIDFFDNYLVAVHEGTGQFICSALADFTDFDALDFATAEAAPDPLITLIVDHRAVVLLGAETMELWENAPSGAGFPFQRIANGVLEIGAIAKHGVCKQDNSVFWLANDRTLRRLSGATPERVSQHGFERAVEHYGTVTDCEMGAYTLEGHLCVVVDFPTENKTWVYDCTTKELHEREGIERRTGWDVSGIAACNGRIYVQRRSTGEIGILDPRTYSQWADTLRAEWAYQSIYDRGVRLCVRALKMGIRTGVGLESGQGSDPRISLEMSQKGGREGTFIGRPTRSLGAQGRFLDRVEWHRLGSGRDIVLRASLSDPVPLTIWNTQADVEAGY